jgi:hypothetical protein
VINLSVQQILITLKATAIRSEDDLLNENNEQLEEEVVGSLLHKVISFYFF